MWAPTAALFSAGPAVSLTRQRMTCKCSVKKQPHGGDKPKTGEYTSSAADFTGQVQLAVTLSMSARFIGDWLAAWIVVFMSDMNNFVFGVFQWEWKEIFFPYSDNKNQMFEHNLMKIAYSSFLITNACV